MLLRASIKGYKVGIIIMLDTWGSLFLLDVDLKIRLEARPESQKKSTSSLIQL
jgi:hypothetical protein